MNKIKIEKEIDTEGLSIIQLKERIEAVIAELEAKGFDPKESYLYLHAMNDILEVNCFRGETPEEEARRVAEEEAERVAYEAAEQKRLQELEEQTIREQQGDHAARHHEMERILAGKTVAELRRMSTI